MANPSKAKGTASESAVVRYMRANGYPGADRQPLRGNRDAGDILLCPGIVLEVKAHKSAGTGQPGHAQLAAWMLEAEAERVNAGALMCPLVIKRAGTADVARFWAYLPVWAAATLMGSDAGMTGSAPLCMSVDVLVALLRGAGYGNPLDVEVAS